MQLTKLNLLFLTIFALLNFTAHGKLMASTRVRPDTVMKINIPNTGYVDRVIPFSMNQDGFFIIASSPNQIYRVDSSNNVEPFLLNIALNSKWITMGSVERCVGGLFTPQYNSLNLVYSGAELGKSFIAQINMKNMSQIDEIISLGANSQVIDVVENHELGSMHILVKKSQSLSLFTLDLKDNSMREQGYPLMTSGKLNFNKDIGLIVGVGNSTYSQLLILDPVSMKIISGRDLDSLGIYTFQSLSSNSFFISVLLSKINTINFMYTFNPTTKVVDVYRTVSYATFKRYTMCEKMENAIACVNNNREIVTEALHEYSTNYYPLDSSENDLTLGFKQLDDEGQLLLYVPQTYVNDDATFRISVFNYKKFQ